MNKDLYSVLGVTESATKDEIKKAFHKLAHKYHPDRPDGDEAKFKEINEAYQTLSNDQKRQQYDSYKKFGGAQGGFNQGQGFSGFSGFENFSQAGFDFGDIFSEFFNQGRQSRKQNKDILVEIEISLKEADEGFVKKIKYPRYAKCTHCDGKGYEPNTKVSKCDKCNGTGKINKVQKTFLGNFQTTIKCDKCDGKGEIYEKKCTKCHGLGSIKITETKEVKIPKGIRNNDKIRFEEFGDNYYSDYIAGDLIVIVKVKNNTKFTRKQDDLYLEHEISFIKAILGSKETIKNLKNEPVVLNIPKGTKGGDILVLKNEGMHKFNSIFKGSLYVTIKINIPKKISRKAEKLLKDLEKEIS